MIAAEENTNAQTFKHLALKFSHFSKLSIDIIEVVMDSFSILVISFTRHLQRQQENPSRKSSYSSRWPWDVGAVGARGVYNYEPEPLDAERIGRPLACRSEFPTAGSRTVVFKPVTKPTKPHQPAT